MAKNNIRKFRLRNGLTQQQVADKLKVSRAAVCQWEKGICYPRMGMIQKLAGLFGCKVSDLIGEVEYNGSLSYDEQKLVEAYRSLNAKGKARLLEDAKTMLASGLYGALV